MYRLTRWVPYDRSGKVSWLLNELGVPFETQDLKHSEAHNSPEYRKAHPLGCVPVLFDLQKQFSLFESGAICLYLADKHEDLGFFGEKGSLERAKCYQWILYNFTNLEPTLEKYWQAKESDVDFENKKADFQRMFLTLLRPIESQLRESAFICGNKFSVADTVLGQSLYWMRNLLVLIEVPATRLYLETLKERPAAKKAALFTED